MNAPPPRGPAHVPTLTEVVQLDAPQPPAHPEAPVAPAALEPMPEGIDEASLAHNVLADVQRQIDLMLEYRLREALAPALARFADTLIKDVRDELAATLREIVARAVAQEIARHRGR